MLRVFLRYIALHWVGFRLPGWTVVHVTNRLKRSYTIARRFDSSIPHELLSHNYFYQENQRNPILSSIYSFLFLALVFPGIF